MEEPETSWNKARNIYPIAIRLVWLTLIGIFVAVSVPNLARKTANNSIHFAGPFHSTDNFLHFDTGEINGTERLLALFGSIPPLKKVVVFVRSDDRQSWFMGMLIAYLSWPHPVRIVDVTQPGWETTAAEKDLLSVGEYVFCRVPAPSWWRRGERFGDTLEFFSAANVAQE